MHLSATLHLCFKDLAQTQPEAPALISDQTTLSYAELDSLSDALAWELLNRGVEHQEAIGVLADRSADLPAAFLAILKAGCVYVPMVADHPAERLASFARLADMRYLIALDGAEPPAPLVEVLVANGGGGTITRAIIRPETTVSGAQHSAASFDRPSASMDDLVAILFTSGSTGKPKGVMIRHGGCTNMALGHIAAQGITSADRILLSTSPGFILGFRELCLPLMSGAAFVPASRELINDPDRFLAMMSRHKVSVALFTPSYLRLFSGVVPQGLRCIITAGERPNGADARHYARQVEYWNVHGATEVCGTICMHRVDGDASGPIPSGQPFANTRVYLLDEQGREVPQGETGEVYIVGAGVARGYLKQPELTARSFVQTPFGRAFRTNDLARWNSEGYLETIGRADDVIKISGQSVLLGEIERTLVGHPAVQRAAALQVDGRLVACVECPQPAMAEQVDWRRFLGKSLPAYMVPAEVAVVARMPISSAGKIDRKALKEKIEAIFIQRRQQQGGAAPQGALEQMIAAVWEEVIGRGPVLREDNFFFIGGTSLMAIAVSQRLQAQGYRVPVQTVLASLSVRELANRIASGGAMELADGLELPSRDSGPATIDQQGFWIASALGLPPASSHILRVLAVQGTVPPPDAWKRAWQALVLHHPALRTAFVADSDSTTCWRTIEAGEFQPRSLFTVDRCATLRAASILVTQRAEERFVPEEPPLARAGLLQVAEGAETIFWFVLHHSVVDGVSVQRLLNDFLALLGGRSLPQAVHGIALASGVEQHYLASARAERDREFWRARLRSLVEAGGAAFEECVAEKPRPLVPSGQGTEPLCRHLGPATATTLQNLARAGGAGLHALLLTLLAHEVRRRRGPGALMLGSGISIRPVGGELAIGHFVNVLPVILDQASTATLAELLATSQQALTETIEYGSYPAGLVQRQFSKEHPGMRPHARTSLFDIALTATMPRTGIDREHDLRLSPRSLPGALEHTAAGLDLSFSHEPCPDEDGGLNLLLAWNGDICSRETAEAWLDSLAAWACWLSEDATRFEQPLPALLPQEAARLEQWEQGERRTYPMGGGHHLFEAIVDRDPQRLAVIANERVETFAALDDRADSWAFHLRGQGLGPGTVVAVLAEVSPDLPAAVLAIWKAGGVYLPLPAELPAARLRDMAEDSAARILIVLAGLPVPPELGALFKTVVNFAEHVPTGRLGRVPQLLPEAPAYIIFTSGTTGKPKGIAISHLALTNIIQGMAETVGLREDDRVSLVSTIGFDASLWELGMGLCLGLTLVPIAPALRDDPWAMKRYYVQRGVTVAFHTPSYLRTSEEAPFEGLRILLTGGEAPSHSDVRQHASSLAFWNFYGPTETTIVAAGGRIELQRAGETVLTVGRPLPNVRISLRHGNGTPVPPGQRGEVWIGGVGIANGYLHLPDLTAERFPTLPEGRVYRSGDYGRWTADGRLEIIGRRDAQVKINGQRVELGEIEQVLRSHPAVIDAVVLTFQAGADRAQTLYGFICGIAGDVNQGGLAAFLTERLPLHMVPAQLIPVDSIPLLPSGKADRQALLTHLRDHCAAGAKEAPQGAREVEMAAIWAEVLGVPAARHDNFFALGGNSLLAVTMAHRASVRLGRQIPARALFTAPTLAAFTARIEGLPVMGDSVGVAFETDLATQGEREFWTAETAGLDTRTFTIPVQYLVLGDFTPDQWHNAWVTLVARHQGLRTFFVEDAAGQLRRRVAPTVEGALELVVLPDSSSALVHIRRRQAEALPMGAAPLWRVGLVQTEDEGKRYFWLALHHAVGDGQSIGTLVAELTSLLAGQTLPPSSDSASVFAAREQTYLGSKDATDDAAYWDNLLERIPVAAFDEWPLDRARSPDTPTGNHRFLATVDPRIATALRTIARNHAASMHAVMVTLLALEARRRAGRTDVVIGTTASIRESVADVNIVGYGVNMLPLHLGPIADPSFGKLLHATQQHLAEALQHARCPFVHIYRTFWNAHPERRHPQRYPLFDLAVTENPGAGSSTGPQRFTRAIAATETISYECTAASPGQDMVLIHEGLSSGELLLQLHLNAAIYSRETARSWFAALLGWARWLAEGPIRDEQPLPHLLPHEARLLAQWEEGERIPRPRLRFHQLFEEVVDRPGQAGRPAVVTLEHQLSYQALEEEANALAHSLLQRGVGRGSVVAVLTGRSAQLPAAALAVWKAGATYLPLAADLPPGRLVFMVRDAGATQLIALDGVAIPAALAKELPDPLRPEALSTVFRCHHSKRPGIPGEPTDIAYILYTSGSTGEPKGTLVGHESYVNLALGAAETYGLTADDRCLMFSSPSFDVSLSDIGVPLVCGAAICPAASATIESPKRLLGVLRDMGVTLVDLTPTYLRLFDGCELPPSIRILVTGGEPPVPVDVATYAPRLRYFNAYGPTENTITSCMGTLSGDGRRLIAAGRPLPNTSIHICTPQGQALPPGVVGEIWLGGIGLCRGYLNRPEQTAAHFMETARGRCYRSGDLGRWHADGQLEILGRIDDQVKLNGIRIELGEIEHALTGHAAIAQAVALLVEQAGGNKSLRVVVRPLSENQVPTEEDCLKYLAKRLPPQMVPSGVLSVPTMPLSAAGKVDRAALLALLAEQPATSGLTLPEDHLERKVAAIWGALLGHSPIHREDNFFALGGHSLLAIAVAHRLEKVLGLEIPARELFAAPTLSGFAERLRSVTPLEWEGEASTNLATAGQREFWTAEQAGLDTCGFNISLTLAVHGEVPAPEQWCAAWNELVVRHDALRTGFFEDEGGALRRLDVARPAATFEIQQARSREEALEDMKTRALEPFAMGNPGLWRAGMTRITTSCETIFWFVMHHAVGDGLSLGILIDELTTLLRGEIPAHPASVFDRSAAREIAYLAGESARTDAAYWQLQLERTLELAPDALDEWPLDKSRPNTRSASTLKGSHCFRYRLDPPIAEGLRNLARRNGASLHACMLALLGLEVRRRTGRANFLLGTAASTRQSAAEARTIGCFVNMLPLSFEVEEGASIDTAVRAMQQELATALQHSHYPFSRIYGEFRRQHPRATQPARYPLIDIAVTENPAFSHNAATGLSFTTMGSPDSGALQYELRRNAPAQDLVLVHEGHPDHGLVLTWFANAAIYTQDTAQAWFDAVIGWARYLTQRVPRADERLPMLQPAEEHLLARWQQGPRRSWSGPAFPDLFRRHAERRPDRAAIITEAGVHSYATVNARANRLAQALLALDLQPGEPVAVLTDRSASLPETVLALWQAGGCYLPLTADLPAERLAFMAKDAGVRILVVLDGLTLPEQLAANRCTVIRPEKLAEGMPAVPPHTPIDADGLAYILYTSGSTGVPKGVVIRHAGLLNLGLGGAEALGIKAEDRALLMASPSFDLWVSDMVIAWSAGAALVPVRREQMNDIPGMTAMFQRLGVTVATMSPSYLRLFERADFPGLRILMTVGEAPFADDVRHYAAKLAYFNGYGPTENTAAVTFGRLHADQEQIVAGVPMANTSVAINDAEGNPVPPGAIGEVWIGGAGLAVGYLNRPDLTAANFVKTAAGRQYRTGDMGRWLRSGELQILGRLDGQVKLRGQRVELGEIENRLAAYPGVQQAVAVVDTLVDRSQRLRAFITVEPQTMAPTPAEWSAYLGGILPSFMIPSTISQVASIPLTAAGKIDRRSLLGRAAADISNIPGSQEMERDGVRTPPQTANERQIAEVWQELLGSPSVAREDDFFSLGGDSLKAIAVVSRLRRAFECQVNDLYEHPVLADFTRHCRPHSNQLLTGDGAVSTEHEQSEPDACSAPEKECGEALRGQRSLYEARISTVLECDLHLRRPYRHVLLTGATGYLGSYLLRELLADSSIMVTALVRGADNPTARARLGQVLTEYFGETTGGVLRDSRRLHVLASDLRHAALRLSERDHGHLAATVDAIYHCAANVNHIGHYADFHADNVAATRHLLSLAMQRKSPPIDFHFVSTLSVAGSTASDEFTLFTEYDFAPDVLDDNYYIRTKQEAEQVVTAARSVLANTCIYRVGNIGFASDSARLQRNIHKNAFFRQLVAFLRLGAVPVELFASISHVDVVARACIALGGAKTLSNEIHHIETSRRDRLAEFIHSAAATTGIRILSCDSDAFLGRLREAMDEPEMESAAAETMEAFGLHAGRSVLARHNRITVVSARTQLLLERLGITWPAMPVDGQHALLCAAMAMLDTQASNGMADTPPPCSTMTAKEM